MREFIVESEYHHSSNVEDLTFNETLDQKYKPDPDTQDTVKQRMKVDGQD